MRILFIAPLPPPITGQSVASKALFDKISSKHDVRVVNLSKNTFRQGISSIKRIYEVASCLFLILFHARKSDVIYLTISQSTAGVIKDIVIYLLCFLNLNRLVIHSHGNGVKRLVFDRHLFLRGITLFFYKRINRLIVLGPTHVPVFADMMPLNKISVVYNYADDPLFLDDQVITNKHTLDNELITVLFLSNLLPGKGHKELCNAYSLLPEEVRNKITLKFAGGFESEADEKQFIEAINFVPGIQYCGVVQRDAKIKLFREAHIFCLPTYYPYEGQPISILEAYASGCAVITTNHAGIGDIFIDSVHGIEVEKKSIASLVNSIEKLVTDPFARLKYGLFNAHEARIKYRAEMFTSSLEVILESVARK
jgi:glycosyltransferase involved in cell wall biosynthesis